MNAVTPIGPETVHQSIEAEQQLLGALMLNDRMTSIVMRAGGAELFAIQLHADIYEAIEVRANAGELVSPVVIKAALQGSRELEQAGVLKQRDARMVLGRGTPLATTQTYCLVFDANHAAVGGAGQPATPQLQAVP